MRKSKLKHYTKLLLQKRAELLKELGMESNVFLSHQTESSGDLSNYSFHPADQGTDEERRELSSLLATLEGKTIEDVDDALRKIYSKRGEYGKCEKCGKSIDDKRLEAIPYTKLCLECQRKTEGV